MKRKRSLTHHILGFGTTQEVKCETEGRRFCFQSLLMLVSLQYEIVIFVHRIEIDEDSMKCSIRPRY